MGKGDFAVENIAGTVLMGIQRNIPTCVTNEILYKVNQGYVTGTMGLYTRRS